MALSMTFVILVFQLMRPTYSLRSIFLAIKQKFLQMQRKTVLGEFWKCCIQIPKKGRVYSRSIGGISSGSMWCKVFVPETIGLAASDTLMLFINSQIFSLAKSVASFLSSILIPSNLEICPSFSRSTFLNSLRGKSLAPLAPIPQETSVFHRLSINSLFLKQALTFQVYTVD